MTFLLCFSSSVFKNTLETAEKCFFSQVCIIIELSCTAMVIPNIVNARRTIPLTPPYILVITTARRVLA